MTDPPSHNLGEILVKFDSQLEEINISSIKNDEQRLRNAKRSTQQIDNGGQTDENTDMDDLSKYTHIADGVKVLDDTSSINRKAIFHDLDRLKHWRESVDKTSPELPKKSTHKTIPEEPVMDQNINLILSSLPVIDQSEYPSFGSEEAAQKLEELERKLEGKYSLHKGQ